MANFGSFLHFIIIAGERGGSVVERRTPGRDVGCSKPTSACCVIEQDILLPESTGNAQEAVARSRND